MHGIKLKKKPGPVKTSEAPDKEEGWFRDPDDYKHLTQEQREELTKAMMSQHKHGVKEMRQLG
jgi:hypothetical protein